MGQRALNRGDVRSPSIGAPMPVWKQLTGEPVAGELRSGFGGRGASAVP